MKSTVFTAIALTVFILATGLGFTTRAAESTSTDVVQKSSLVSFSQDVRPILSNSCAKCHSGNNALPNLLDYKVAYPLRSAIKSKVQSKEMPHVGRLTESDADLVVLWVDTGAKE